MANIFWQESIAGDMDVVKRTSQEFTQEFQKSEVGSSKALPPFIEKIFQCDLLIFFYYSCFPTEMLKIEKINLFLFSPMRIFKEISKYLVDANLSFSP